MRDNDLRRQREEFEREAKESDERFDGIQEEILRLKAGEEERE